MVFQGTVEYDEEVFSKRIKKIEDKYDGNGKCVEHE